MKYLLYRSSFVALGLSCLLFLAGLLSPSTALAHAAHAVLLRSDPQEGSLLTVPPTSIHLWFSEPVQVVGESISLFDPQGRAVKHGPVQVNRAELSIESTLSLQGTYLVSWQVISQDTDPASGRFIFSVARKSGVWAEDTGSGGASLPGLILQVLARWLHFIGFALGFGPLAFRWLVLQPLKIEQDESIESRLWRLVNTGIVLLLFAEPLALMAQSASLGSGSLFNSELMGDILASSFGRVMAQRLGAALVLWVLIGVIRQGTEGAAKVALVLGLALALVDSEASHAFTSGPLWLGFSATALHVAAMVLWVGGLVTLLGVWGLKEIQVYQHPMLMRFGNLATLAVIELALSGLILAWLHLRQLSDLFITSYGNALLIKLLFFLMALFLAFVGMRVSQKYRRRLWLWETIALSGLLVLAGLLVSFPPPV